MAIQDSRRVARATTGGRPGDRTYRAWHAPNAAALLSTSPASLVEVLRRSRESTQYLAIRYTDRLIEAGIESSVGSRGDAYDNALAEAINGLYNTEGIHHLGPGKGLEEVEYATLEWVAWYNSEHLMEPLGYLSPAEQEERFHCVRTDIAVRALD